MQKVITLLKNVRFETDQGKVSIHLPIAVFSTKEKADAFQGKEAERDRKEGVIAEGIDYFFETHEIPFDPIEPTTFQPKEVA